MSLIKSFNGIIPNLKFAKQITSPNISYLHKSKIDKKLNFFNVLNNPNLSYANKILKILKKKEILINDYSNNFYLYRIKTGNKVLSGIVGKINLKNYDNKKILGHEETFSERIKKRKKQLIKFKIQISPIYTTYKASLKKLIELNSFFKAKPNYNFKSKDNCIHKMWVINTKKKRRLIQNYLNKIKKIYICDGHHRIQAMLKSKKKFAPMIIAFPNKEVNILDYNRVVKSKLKTESLTKIILKNFSIKRSNKNKKLNNGEIEMFQNNKWYLLKPLKKLNDLDVTILKKNIIDKIVNNKKDIEYISGVKGKKILEKYVKSKKYNLAFRLCPTTIDEVISFAEKNKYMPPKSTWFHPKPLDGLISSEIISQTNF